MKLHSTSCSQSHKGFSYSHASFNQPRLRPHWGEPLFYESRRLLQEEFDCPSIFLAQTYVLLATYHLTFGGTRKAWLYMGNHRHPMSYIRIYELTLPYKVLLEIL